MNRRPRAGGAISDPCRSPGPRARPARAAHPGPAEGDGSPGLCVSLSDRSRTDAGRPRGTSGGLLAFTDSQAQALRPPAGRDSEGGPGPRGRRSDRRPGDPGLEGPHGVGRRSGSRATPYSGPSPWRDPAGGLLPDPARGLPSPGPAPVPSRKGLGHKSRGAQGDSRQGKHALTAECLVNVKL